MRSGGFLAALSLSLAGCGSTIPPPDIAPYAKAAALERARADLACENAAAQILDNKAPARTAYDIDRHEYLVEVRGCGKRTEYTVACSKFARCSALAERGLIERTE